MDRTRPATDDESRDFLIEAAKLVDLCDLPRLGDTNSHFRLLHGDSGEPIRRDIFDKQEVVCGNSDDVSAHGPNYEVVAPQTTKKRALNKATFIIPKSAEQRRTSPRLMAKGVPVPVPVNTVEVEVTRPKAKKRSPARPPKKVKVEDPANPEERAAEAEIVAAPVVNGIENVTVRTPATLLKKENKQAANAFQVRRTPEKRLFADVPVEVEGRAHYLRYFTIGASRVKMADLTGTRSPHLIKTTSRESLPWCNVVLGSSDWPALQDIIINRFDELSKFVYVPPFVSPDAPLEGITLYDFTHGRHYNTPRRGEPCTRTGVSMRFGITHDGTEYYFDCTCKTNPSLRFYANPPAWAKKQ